jgi:hypothetical protein
MFAFLVAYGNSIVQKLIICSFSMKMKCIFLKSLKSIFCRLKLQSSLTEAVGESSVILLIEIVL